MHARSDILVLLPRAEEALGKEPGLAVAYLFGSVLDETRARVGDVDFAVLGTGPLSWARLCGIGAALAHAIQTDDVDVVDLATCPLGIRFEVLSKGRLILERDPDADTRLRERTLREHLATRHHSRLYYRLLAEEYYRSFAHVDR